MTTNLNGTFAAVQAASRELALLSDDTINQILNAVADAAIAETPFILSENEKDLEEIDQTVRRKLRFVPVSRVEEVFSEALVSESKKTAAQPEEMPLLAVQSCTARPDLRV